MGQRNDVGGTSASAARRPGHITLSVTVGARLVGRRGGTTPWRPSRPRPEPALNVRAHRQGRAASPSAGRGLGRLRSPTAEPLARAAPGRPTRGQTTERARRGGSARAGGTSRTGAPRRGTWRSSRALHSTASGESEWRWHRHGQHRSMVIRRPQRLDGGQGATGPGPRGAASTPRGNPRSRCQRGDSRRRPSA